MRFLQRIGRGRVYEIDALMRMLRRYLRLEPEEIDKRNSISNHRPHRCAGQECTQ